MQIPILLNADTILLIANADTILLNADTILLKADADTILLNADTILLIADADNDTFKCKYWYFWRPIKISKTEMGYNITTLFFKHIFSIQYAFIRLGNLTH